MADCEAFSGEAIGRRYSSVSILLASVNKKFSCRAVARNPAALEFESCSLNRDITPVPFTIQMFKHHL